MTLRHASAWLLAGLGLIASGQARAHPTFGVSAVNRYGRLVLRTPARLHLAYTVMVGDLPALSLRTQADGNHDGRLDAAEQEALLAQVQTWVQAGVRLSQQGQPALVQWSAEPFSLPEPQVAARAFAVELHAEIRGTGGGQPSSPTRWSYRDQVELPASGEIELRIEDGPAVILQATQGPTRSDSEAQALAVPRLFLLNGGEAAARALQVELQLTEPEPPARPGGRIRGLRPLWGVGILGVLGAVVAGAAWRRRTRTRAAS